jgi:hypothetical protein
MNGKYTKYALQGVSRGSAGGQQGIKAAGNIAKFPQSSKGSQPFHSESFGLTSTVQKKRG